MNIKNLLCILIVGIHVFMSFPTVLASNDTEADRYYKLGQNSEKSGNYEAAAENYEQATKYAKAAGREDILNVAPNKALHYKTVFDTYTLSDSPQKTYGAKYEPNGITYGEVSEHRTSSESMILLYIDYGDSNFNYYKEIFKSAKSNGQSIELALNFSGQVEMNKVQSDMSFIKDVKNLINSYSSVPVYLRIAAEMNIWDPAANPAQFKSNFIKIAEYIRENASSAAIMWSVSHTSSWMVDINTFYPGDSYVDWIGVSAYCNKYFNGADASWDDQAYFHTGEFSDPVLLIHEVVEKYGDRKPIMVTECGAAYYTGGNKKDTDVNWAELNLRKILNNIPMIYPQVKAICYFNKKMTNEINFYDLDSNSAMKNTYSKVTKSGWFIQSKYNNSSKFFKNCSIGLNVTDGNLNVYSYAHVFGVAEPSVRYYIDNKEVASVNTVPYNAKIDVSGYKNGMHTLKSIMSASNGVTATKEYSLNISGNSVQYSFYDDVAGLNSIQSSVLKAMFDKGVINGYDDNTMKPYGSLTRAEFATMLCRAMNYTTSGNASFIDTTNHWASSYIQACVKKGAIDGVGDNMFAPDNSITFEQAVKIITIATGMSKGYDMDSMGGYPTAYIKLGQNYDLYDNVENPVKGEKLTRIDAITLMFNASGGKIASNGTSGEVTVTTPKPTAAPTPAPTKAPVEKTMYRYRDKETKSSTSSSMSGWTRTGSDNTYGNWSSYQDGYISSSDNIEVRTQTVQKETKHYKTQYWYGGYFWTLDGRYQSSAKPKSGVDNVFRDTGWIDYQLELSQDFGGGYIMYRNQNDGLYYFRNPNDSRYQPPTRDVYSHSTYETKTQYSSRSKTTTYYYERWGSWSNWSSNRVSESSTRQVETKTVWE